VTASGEKKKVVSEFSEGDVSDTTLQRHNYTNFEAEISCAYIVPEKET
jgi:hypothetical protein